VPNVLRQCLTLLACFPSLAVYGFQAFSHYHCNNSLIIHSPQPELSIAENILHMLRPDSAYTRLEATLLDSLKVLGSLQTLEAMAGSLLPREAMPLGGRLARYRLYRTADGGQVSLGALEQKFWARFCTVVERPEWSTRQSDPELAAALETLFASRPLADWADLSRREPEICLEPVVGISQAADSREELQPVSFGGERPISQGRAPAKGAHTQQILHEWGLSEQEISSLFAKGVVSGAQGSARSDDQ
jgi:crotonobetainyl-CoA:carnitine CoA-transferase CaiB-like acyl-CoA transferase